MSWVHEVLDTAQLHKHFQLLAALKLPGNADRWWTSAEVDTVLLPHGARVEGFPAEWLERMQETHCGRSSRYEIRPNEGPFGTAHLEGRGTTSTGLHGEEDDDDAASSSFTPTRFAIRFVVRQPRSMLELVRMMRYPRAPEDGGSDDDGNDDDDDFDLALLSTAFSDASSDVVALVTQAHRDGRIFAVSAGPPPSELKSGSKSGTGASPGADDAAFEFAAPEVPQESDFGQWWREGPLKLRTTHLTRRFVAERFMNTLPSAMDEGESLIIDLVRNSSHWLNTRQPTSAPDSSALVHRYAIRIEVFPRPQDGGLLSVSLVSSGGVGDQALDKVHVEMGAQREALTGVRVAIKYRPHGSSGTAANARRGLDGAARRESGNYSANVKFSIERMPREGSSGEPASSWEEFSTRTWEVTLVPRWSFATLGGDEFRDDRSGVVRKARGDRSLVAFFRKELAYPAESELPLHPPILLPCFDSRRKRDRAAKDDTEADPHIDDLPLTLQQSWWANISPNVLRSAAARQPTVEEVAVAAADVMVAASAAPLEVESLLRKPDANAALKSKKRQRYRELRNTHMLFYGLDLQKPYQPQLHFHPPPY